MPAVRLWARIALIATIVAACFAVILIGLDAKAVKDGRDLNNALETAFGTTVEKPKIISAQLAFACLEFVLCLVFVGIFIAVSVLASRKMRPPPGFAMRRSLP